MFIGHFGVGLGAKKAAPKVSLGTFFLACQFLDLLWPAFLLLGWETVKIEPGNTLMTPLNFVSYPISHSLFMAVVWGVLFGLVYFSIRKNFKNSIILGLCVISHWILDLLVHKPDLPIFPWDSAYVGFGLWNNAVFEIIVESLIFIAGLVLYLSTTKPKNKAGILVFWSLILFLIVVHISNITGPPPPDVFSIAIIGQSQWLLIFWAYWADKNRILKN